MIFQNSSPGETMRIMQQGFLLLLLLLYLATSFSVFYSSVLLNKMHFTRLSSSLQCSRITTGQKCFSCCSRQLESHRTHLTHSTISSLLDLDFPGDFELDLRGFASFKTRRAFLMLIKKGQERAIEV